MRLTLRLYATLRRYVAGAQVGVPLEAELADGATVADLVRHLGLPADEVKVAFVNGRARPPEWRLQDGDEVGMFPPIGGG